MTYPLSRMFQPITGTRKISVSDTHLNGRNSTRMSISEARRRRNATATPPALNTAVPLRGRAAGQGSAGTGGRGGRASSASTTRTAVATATETAGSTVSTNSASCTSVGCHWRSAVRW